MIERNNDSMHHQKRQTRGFTLVELLVVIGIIVILFAVVLVAIDPAKRLAQARDAVRRQDVRDLVEAMQQYVVDNDGDVSGLGIDAVEATYQQIGTAASGCDAGCGAQTTLAACVDLSAALVDEYVSEVPVDPLTGTEAISDYYVNISDNGRIEVGACDPEEAADISVKR